MNLKLMKKAYERDGKTYYSFLLTNGVESIVIKGAFDKDAKGNPQTFKNFKTLEKIAHYCELQESEGK